MSRERGRRVAERPPGRRPRPGPRRRAPLGAVLAALAVVALTVAALFAAGATDNATGPRPQVTSRLDLGTRSFTCTGGLPGTTGVAGTVSRHGTVSANGRPLHGASSRPSFRVSQPVRVRAGRAAAPGAYAVQSASSSRWLATAACVEPRPTWWFVGAGASDRHDTVLTVANPRPGIAIFDVDVSGPDGPVNAPGLHGLTLGSGQTRTLDLARLAPATGDLAVRIRSSRGLVAAMAAERWAPGLIGKQVREWVAPQLPPARSTELTGLPGGGTSTLLVANPGVRQGVVRLRLVGKQGTFDPTSHASVTVPAGTVQELDLSSVVSGGTAAVRLSANVPVVATVRSVRGNDEAYAAAAEPISGRSVVGIPLGGRSTLVLSSAGPETGRHPATADLRVSGPGSRWLMSRQVAVPPAGAATVALPHAARAVSVSTSGGDVTGVLVVRAAAGIGTIPISPSATALRRPGVLPAW